MAIKYFLLYLYYKSNKMKTILILLSSLTLTFVSYSQKKSLFEWPIADETIDINVAKKEGFAMSFSRPSYYVYKEKVNMKNSLASLDMYMDLGTTNDQFFYFFDIENKKITVVQNRNMVYTFNFSKVSIKNNVLIFKIKKDDKSVSIFVDLNDHIFKISEYYEAVNMSDVSVSVDVYFYPKK